MLTHLSIRNVVLIAACDISFAAGLNVLTGETGAGKSILLDSLGLVLGARGESRLIRNGQEQASVSATFALADSSPAYDVLETLGLEAEDELIIRRSLRADGKTRCFINDQPVSVAALRQVGEVLVEVQGQHAQRGLLDASSHLEVLDAYGRLSAERIRVSDAYDTWRGAQLQLEELQRQMARDQAEQDYLQHMHEELRQLDAQPGEEEQLAEQRTRLMQNEKLADLLADAMNELEGQRPVESSLHQAQRMLTRSTLQVAERFNDAIEALERAQIEVQEAVRTLSHLQDECAYDPNVLDQAEERLFALKAAARKYDVQPEELPDLCMQVEAKLRALECQQEATQDLEEQVAQARENYLDEAERLSAARVREAQRLQQAVLMELAPLKMEKTRFVVRCERLDDGRWHARGMDRIAFEVATNAGQEAAPIHKVASGGELSRFLLALKVVLSSVKGTPTLIFDEIDTGTGGAVADAIGGRLALLSDQSQVLVVTHLPQVAARGHQHLMIEKFEEDGQTQTTVQLLDVERRKEELARMLAGAEVTEEARGAAGKLMELAS